MASVINIEDISWRLRNQRLEKLKEYQPMEGSNEVNKTMNQRLYESAKNCDVDAILDDLEWISNQDQISLTTIFKQVSPSGNSLLHVAASYGCKEITELLDIHFPELITRKNFQGDTAIHLAARAGKLNTLTTLINRVENRSSGSLGVKNYKGNTPLHEAVISKQYEGAHHLLWADHQVAYYHNGENINKGKSPLYLAAEIGDEKMLGLLLQAIAPDGAQSLDKLQGLSPAHAAVKHKNIEILKMIAEIKPELLSAKETGGNNALHFASSIGYLKGVQFLLQKYSDGAIEKNEEGFYPIHVACKKGSLEVVKELLKQWPEPAEFVNAKGQNILHVAAENGRENVVKHILKSPELTGLFNERDKDGNTPLHLATMHTRPLAVYALVREEKVNKVLINNENLTPYDEAEKQSKEAEEIDLDKPISDGKNEQCISNTASNGRMDLKGSKQLDVYGLLMTYSILFFYGKPPKRPIDYFLRIKPKPLSREDIKGRVEVLLVAAVLVAGVTFSAACQVPKSASGSDDDSSDQDKTTKILLHFYFLFDLLALNFSVAASIILCWVQLYNIKLATHLVWLASALVGSSIYQMFMAFLFAIAIDATEINLIFVSVFVVGGIFFIIHSILFVPMAIPPSANKMIEKLFSPFFYIAVFWFYLIFQRVLAFLPSLFRSD